MGNSTSTLADFFSELPKTEECRSCNKIIQIYEEEFYRCTKSKNMIEKCKSQINDKGVRSIMVLTSIPYDARKHIMANISDDDSYLVNCLVCVECGVVKFNTGQQQQQNTPISNDTIGNIALATQQMASKCKNITPEKLKNGAITREEYNEMRKTITAISRQIDNCAAQNNINLQTDGKKYYCTACDGFTYGALKSNCAAFTKIGKFICDLCFKKKYCCADGCNNQIVWRCNMCAFSFCSQHSCHRYSIVKKLNKYSNEYEDISCEISESGKDYWKEIKGWTLTDRCKRKQVWNYERSCYEWQN